MVFEFIKNLIGKKKKKEKDRKFYLEKEKKKPSRETYKMPREEEAGGVPSRVPGEGRFEERERPELGRERGLPMESRGASREGNLPEFPRNKPIGERRIARQRRPTRERQPSRKEQPQRPSRRGSLEDLRNRVDSLEDRVSNLERRLRR